MVDIGLLMIIMAGVGQYWARSLGTIVSIVPIIPDPDDRLVWRDQCECQSQGTVYNHWFNYINQMRSS
jgi:hypothetical protein